MAELTSRLAEVEETLAKTQKELLKAQDTNSRLQRDLTENIAQKEDQVPMRNTFGGAFAIILYIAGT